MRPAASSRSSSSSTTARRRRSTSRAGRPTPTSAAPGTGIEAKWLGQDGQDRAGAGAGVGPDGFEDVHVALTRLSAKAEIKGVDITGPGGLAWHAGLNPRGPGRRRTRPGRRQDPGRPLLRHAPRPRRPDAQGEGRLRFPTGPTPPRSSPPSATRPSRRRKARAVDLPSSKATARWLGQDGVGTAPGDVHVEIEGLTPNRPIAAAGLERRRRRHLGVPARTTASGSTPAGTRSGLTYAGTRRRRPTSPSRLSATSRGRR